MASRSYILYIEDDRSMVEFVGKALKLWGHKVMGATSGKQGLAMMQERKPALVLLDLMMPDTNGWDVYRKMKGQADLSDIPVVVISAVPPENSYKIIDDLPPVEAYLPKPFEIEDLMQAVSQLLEGDYTLEQTDSTPR